MPFYHYSKGHDGVTKLELRGTQQSIALTLHTLQRRKLAYTVEYDPIDYTAGRGERSCTVFITEPA